MTPTRHPHGQVARAVGTPNHRWGYPHTPILEATGYYATRQICETVFIFLNAGAHEDLQTP